MRVRLLFAVWLLASLAVMACDTGDDDDNDDTAPADDDQSDDDDDNNDDDNNNDDDDDDSTPEDPVDLVNPFIGTGGLGFGYASAFPGVKTPFGMMALNPNTTLRGFNFGFNHFSGYYYPDTQIRGFTHTQIHGTGAPDYGNLLVMPMSRKPSGVFGESDFRSFYSHANETATPGYYSVLLDDPQVLVELTAADYAGIQRYTFPEDGEPYVVVYPSYSIEASWVWNATVEIDPAANTVAGMLDFHGPMSGRDGGFLLYYVIEFAQPIADYGTWKDGVIADGQTSETGADIGAFVGIAGAKAEPLLLRSAISYQSLEQAYANLAAQMPAWDFEGTAGATRQRWRDVLSRIELVGGTAEQRRIFYTAIYHAYFHPTAWVEANNRYLGFDLQTHDAGDRRYYTDFSLWDTFRTLHPLLNLIDPQTSSDMMQSLTDMYLQGGSIPKWPMAEGYTGSMIGTSADVVLAEAYLKGIRDWDYESAYEGCYAHATGPVPDDGRECLAEILAYGYAPEDLCGTGVSATTESSYDDAALSWWAAAMGLDEDAAMFHEHSLYYRNHFDPQTGFLRARNSDGSFVSPFFSWYVFDENYVEGNAWHWSFYAPHDALGLIDLYGSPEAFVAKLSHAFEAAMQGPDNGVLPDVFYWHGNEPDLFNAYLFNYADRPDLTQKYVRWILDAKYADTPGGLDGNDDCGTLSAWYVFSALGFFPLAGSDVYLIGSPLFDGATLHLPGGDLVVTVQNNSAENIYVQSVLFNGELVTEPFFAHAQLAGGGTLEFFMGPEPAKPW